MTHHSIVVYAYIEPIRWFDIFSHNCVTAHPLHFQSPAAEVARVEKQILNQSLFVCFVEVVFDSGIFSIDPSTVWPIPAVQRLVKQGVEESMVRHGVESDKER